MKLEYRIEAGDFTRAGDVSSDIKKRLKQLGISPAAVKRTVIALYEAEVNVVAHADGGQVTADILPEGIRIRIEDRGPGIPDIALAMQPGFSTASQRVREMGFGAGMGLPNIRQNTDELQLESVVGQGTVLTFYNKFN